MSELSPEAPPKVRLASTGVVKLERVIDLSYKALPSSGDEKMEDMKFKQSLEQTTPIIIPAHQLLVRGFTTHHFSLPPKKGSHHRNYSREFAVAAITPTDIMGVILQHEGFFYRKEQQYLIAALLRRVALGDVSKAVSSSAVGQDLGDRVICVKPDTRPFRVTPGNLQNNGNRYVASPSGRAKRPFDLTWQAKYWQMDDVPDLATIEE